MDDTRFDAWTRRRFGLAAGGAAVSLLGLAAGLPSPTGAKKTKKKRAKHNRFGCVDVGKPCRGKDAKCCSGRCQGKKPKRGEKDASRCVAHHVGGCRTSEDICTGPPALPSSPEACGANGHCFRTTGKASFCGDDDGIAFSPCSGCAKDADCVADFGPAAACVVCAGECVGPDTVCIPAAV